MFSWFKTRRPPPPITCEANPGHGVHLDVGFANAKGSWTERVDIVRCMAGVLASEGCAYSLQKTWIELDAGIILQPRFVELQPLETGGVHTLTTIEARCPNIIPEGVFEFQHSHGEDSEKAISQGFRDWIKLDLPVLVDSLRFQPMVCTFLKLEFPAPADSPPRKRRVVLGPVSYYAAQPAAPPEAHPFCPCCLFTNTAKAFKERVENNDFHAVRFYAARDSQGRANADCRVNGQDFEPGKVALIEYAKSWPDRGMEFRKQYVIIQSEPVSG